jgi:hypothetical protein
MRLTTNLVLLIDTVELCSNILENLFFCNAFKKPQHAKLLFRTAINLAWGLGWPGRRGRLRTRPVPSDHVMRAAQTRGDSGSHMCLEPSWCSITPVIGRRGRRLRCAERFTAGRTSPQACSTLFGEPIRSTSSAAIRSLATKTGQITCHRHATSVAIDC